MRGGVGRVFFPPQDEEGHRVALCSYYFRYLQHDAYSCFTDERNTRVHSVLAFISFMFQTFAMLNIYNDREETPCTKKQEHAFFSCTFLHILNTYGKNIQKIGYELGHKRNLSTFQKNRIIDTILTMFFSYISVELEFNIKG